MIKEHGAKSTTDEVLAGLDLKGKRYLVTGASSGVGLETARALAAHGAEVVGAARNLAKGERAVESIRAAAHEGGGNVELIQLDLASLESVRACTDRLVADGRRFDAVIANAGVMASPFGHTADGFETQFGTNHLGHFLLVNRIASLITDHGRLVVLSSNGHRSADVDFDDPDFKKSEYDRWAAYGRSKTANSLFAVEFDRRHRDRGVRASAVMPGVSPTDLARHLSQEDLTALGGAIQAGRAAAGLPPLEYKTLPQMAATSVWAAAVADAEEIGGRYLEDCHVAEVNDDPAFPDAVMSYAVDPDNAARLWSASEELVGERF